MPDAARTPLEVNFPAPTAAHVDEAARRLVEAFDPLRILAFGSWARGTARPGSDLDLLVVLSEEALAALDGKREAAIAMRRALRGSGVLTDIIVTTPEEIERRGWIIGTVLREALKEGQAVYEHAEAR